MAFLDMANPLRAPRSRTASTAALWSLAMALLALTGCARSGLILTPDGGSDSAACVVDADCDSGGCVGGVCEPVQGLCEEDGDCPVGTHCDMGVCVDNQSCVDDSDCPPSMTCEDGTCLPIGSCDDDDDCPAWAHCEDGQCVQDTVCDSDDDCPTGQMCEDGLCTDRASCTDDDDCPSRQACEDGFCVDRDTCGEDADCDVAERCEDGLCVDATACTEHGDCPSDELCVDGFCAPLGACTDDDDCPAGTRCEAGQCVQNASCTDDGDCPALQECIDALCTDRAACTEDADCPSTETCEEGTCLPIGDCEDDDDCPAFAHCEDGQCVTNDACESDDDCPTAQACTDGYCVDRDTCTEHTDCEPTELCDPDGICQPIGACIDDDDCPPNAACEDDVCTQNDACDDNDDCPDTQTCIDGLCSDNLTCSEDSDCPLNQSCIDEVCTYNPACIDDLDCPVTERCVDEMCTRIGDDCTEHDDCGPGNACDNGQCVRAPCTSAAECDDGAFCNGNEICDPLAGCLSGTAPTADDGVACTVATCDEDNDVIAHVPDDSLCPATGDCTVGACSAALGCQQVPDDTRVPPQVSATDCARETCAGGAIVRINDDSETPPQVSDSDCVAEVCAAGAVTTVPDNNETPPQTSTTDCVTDICLGGVPSTTPNNNEVPPQLPDDCVDLICQGGVAAAGPANDAEVPPDDGSECNTASCSGGVPTYAGDDGQCDDAVACTIGSCQLDGTCAHLPDDSQCSCPGGDVGYCRPGDGGAGADGCVCLTPASLTCSAAPTVGQVLDPFTLTANIGGAAPGATLLWELVGVPAGADPSAHILSNASQPVATFTPTTASADASDVYTLQVTLTEPDLPEQTCFVTLEAQPLPDEFEVNLIMSDGLDVDLHVLGGNRTDNIEYLRWDMPFHPEHNPSLGDDPDRDCYFANCPVCSADIPDQPACVPVTTRIVDFDRPVADGAALADAQDPQLDIDNRRGCYTDLSGAPVCIPERVTVETPSAGPYFVWAYLYGDALSITPGELSTPTTTVVEIEVTCRGATQRYPRVLSSEDETAAGTPAATASFERIGGASGFVRFEVPTDPNAPCVLPAP
jgi:hypothetical protein